MHDNRFEAAIVTFHNRMSITRKKTRVDLRESFEWTVQNIILYK